ncbi:MAG: lysophospholipid acyltransferase family protein [Myxococcota bacterium]|nr:lysophospholipid acyltransferase family protein [Myxococcota bacterium]
MRHLELGYRLLASALGWGFMVGSWLLWSALVVPATLLLSRVWPGAFALFDTVTQGLLRIYVQTLLSARIEVEGEEHRLPGTRVLVSNHQSLLDPIVLLALEPHLCGPIRGSLYRLPLLGPIVRVFGFHPVGANEVAPLEELRQNVELARARGGALLFFPEGTRSRTGEVGPFRRGAFRTAVDHDLPIQPLVIEGLDRVLPPGRILTPVAHRYPVRIRYLPALHPPYGSGVRRNVVRALCETVRGVLVDELARLRGQRDIN